MLYIPLETQQGFWWNLFLTVVGSQLRITSVVKRTLGLFLFGDGTGTAMLVALFRTLLIYQNLVVVNRTLCSD